MPTYYAGGEYYSDDPLGEEVYLEDEYDYDEDDDYDSSPSHARAREAVDVIAARPASQLPDMRVPNVTRYVSCEWEGSSGVSTASVACGMLSDGVESEYHGDGTCDGEVVFGYLALWQDDIARRYARSVSVIEQLRTDGVVRVGFNAGHHIHVAARDATTGVGLSPNNLVSLYSVFAHCEDLLYRFASAGWSQHRSEQDGSYSSPMLKLGDRIGGTPQRTAKNIGNTIGNERYQGLNVTPYVDSISRCRCGAYRFGEWQSCECSDDRMTIEWRLWNAAISPRKIRAYIAISAVLTDYASKVDPRDVTKLDEHPFSGTGRVDEDELLVQLDYLASRPGFTARDRKDIYWLASISPGMGDLGREYESSRGEMLHYAYDASPVVG